MSNGRSGYFLKEYGSWSVLTIAYATGLAVSRGFSAEALPLFLALGLLINSKQAFTKWIRGARDYEAILIFLAQIVVAAGILIALLGNDIRSLLWLLIFPLAYLIMNKLAGEHFVLTEVLGFTLISLAAVLAKFILTGGVDIRLFVAVALYFSAGVFKVKALLRKRALDRFLAVLYVVFAAFVYRGFYLPLIVLLPLADNVIAAGTLYKVRLKTTGWIEVGKSLLFLVLMAAFY